jgi:hypothetical protein
MNDPAFLWRFDRLNPGKFLSQSSMLGEKSNLSQSQSFVQPIQMEGFGQNIPVQQPPRERHSIFSNVSENSEIGMSNL